VCHALKDSKEMVLEMFSGGTIHVRNVGLLINPLQRFSVTTAIPMPLSPGSICDNMWPDPYPNPPFVKWCDLRFFGIFQQGREL